MAFLCWGHSTANIKDKYKETDFCKSHKDNCYVHKFYKEWHLGCCKTQLTGNKCQAEGKTGSRKQSAEPDVRFRRNLDGLSGSNVEDGFKGD